MKENQSLPEVVELVKRAQELVRSEAGAEQVVAAWTAGGDMVCFVNHDIMSGSTDEEDAFIKMLADRGDTQIRYILCMWNDFSIDMISRHLLESLTGLDPLNKETEVILKGAQGFQRKPLKACLPS